MKYLLGIGFIVTEKYRKDPVARVNIDDTFIDEIVVDDYPNYDKVWVGDENMWPHTSPVVDYDHKGGRILDGHKRTLFQPTKSWTFPKKFKTYVIDQDQLQGKKQLVVKIQNSDSNYNNGFMTKSTLIDMNAFLVPLKWIKLFKSGGTNHMYDFNQEVADPEHAGNYFMLKGRLATCNGEILRRAEGYPFAWKSFWNGEERDSWAVGGDGTLRIQLLTKKSGTVMFDPYDQETLLLQSEKKVEQDTGFYISEKFFSLAHQKVFDKYLYNENQ